MNIVLTDLVQCCSNILHFYFYHDKYLFQTKVNLFCVMSSLLTLTNFIGDIKNQIVNIEKRFSQHGRSDLWKFSKYSASIRNYRNRAEKYSHTPIELV